MSDQDFRKLLKRIERAADGGATLISQAVGTGRLTWQQRFQLGSLASDSVQATATTINPVSSIPASWKRL